MPRFARLPYVSRTSLQDGTPRFRGYCDVGAGVLRKRVFSSTFPTEREAHDAAMRMRRANERRGEVMDLDRAAAVLLEDLRTKRTKGSVIWYTGHLAAVRRVIPGTTALWEISRATVEKFIRTRLQDWAKLPVLDKNGKVVEPGRHVKPATVNADLRALHRVFVIAKRSSPDLHNPVAEVERPRADDIAMDWFTETEVRDLLARVDHEPDRDLFTVFALTGLRLSEVARLRVPSVRLNTLELVVAGKNRTRIIPIRAALEAPLRRLLALAEVSPDPDKHLVPGRVLKHGNLKRPRDGEAASLARIKTTFVRWRRRLGERRLHPHSLRHTFGTALTRKGVQLDLVMRLMGHSKITTTQKYLHSGGPSGAAALDQLDVVPPALPCAPEPAALR